MKAEAHPVIMIRRMSTRSTSYYDETKSAVNELLHDVLGGFLHQ